MDPTSVFIFPCSRMMFVSPFHEDGQNSHRFSCWWQPSNRWVALVHLPAYLLDPRLLAPIVAHFGSLVSISYLANFKDKKVILVSVKNCTITIIPHILMVCVGGTIIPVRSQVILVEKVKEEGIFFDPSDIGDDCWLAISSDQSSVNPVMHTRPADLFTSVLLSGALHTSTKDKGKQTGSSSASIVDSDSDWSLQGGNTLLGFRIFDQVCGFSLTPPPGPISFLETAQGKPVSRQDSDPSHIEGSHQYPISENTPPIKSTALSTSDSAVCKEAVLTVPHKEGNSDGLVGKTTNDDVKEGNTQQIYLSNQAKPLVYKRRKPKRVNVSSESPSERARSHKATKEDPTATLRKEPKELPRQTSEKVDGNLGAHPQLE